MFLIALVLLLAAMPLGLIVLTRILKHKRTPKPIVVLHGIFAGFGLLIVLTYIALGNITILSVSGALLLLFAAAGGFVMFGIDVSKKPVPKALAIMHPILAASGVIILIYYAVRVFS